MTITASRFGLASALVAVAALIGLTVVAPNVPLPALGGPPATTAPTESGGILVYELGGVIYLADADGSDPTRVGDGYLQQTWMTGSVWSPDGRHFIYRDGDGTTQMSDAEGRVVASFASTFATSWSPDSTLLQGWTSDETRIAVYGIDGVLQASLALPEGYGRLYETEGVWAPDGRSVLVHIRQSDRGEAWELPIDGSAPRRLADDHPFARRSRAFSRDGRRVAYVVQPPEAPAPELVVANADGSDARTVARLAGPNDVAAAFLEWSPDGERLAYFMSRGGQIDLVVLEVATGTISTAVPEFSREGYPPFSWSSASDRLLFAAPGDGGDTSLWSVNVDGTGRRLLVEGSTWGAMSPASSTDASGDPPGEVVDATPSPTSTPSAAGVRPGASLIRIAGHDVSVVLPAAVAGQVPTDGDAGNHISLRNDVGSGWMVWYLYAPGGIVDPSRDTFMLPLPDDPVAWLRQLPGLTVLAERDIEVGGQPARLLDVSLPGESGAFVFVDVPTGDSGATRSFGVPGVGQSRYVIWRLGETWMVAQGHAVGIGALKTADAPGDPFMQFIADLRFP
ncbi:MAG: PD40 domain-containing protein [Chloroflexi bacterium]|nr:PD40 domain-containing protein [Chloroflexota bacterium]